MNLLIIHFFSLFQPSLLTREQREEKLQSLFSNNWSLVKDRDAIYKEFLFSDFIQVNILCCLLYFINFY